MYDLTITTDTNTRTIAYNDFADAHQALMAQVIGWDLYLQAPWPTPRNAPSFKLLSLEGRARDPRIIGTATIAPTPAKPVIAPYYSAESALRWTAEHTTIWLPSSDTDPGARDPMAVLTGARAEARHLFAAGTIYQEAASLSDANDTDLRRPSQYTFERLRDSAIKAGRQKAITTTAALAGAVQHELTADITEQQAAALIWYYALILWGVTAS